MKKIILTLGLSIAFTISPGLSENLTDQSYSAILEETRKTYIKPFVGRSTYLPQVLNAAKPDFAQLAEKSITKSRQPFYRTMRLLNPFHPWDQQSSTEHAAGCNLSTVLFAGIDIGRDINDYFGIAGEILYYYSQYSFREVIIEGLNYRKQELSVNGNLLSLGVTSCMLKPVISVIHSESFSFYITGGIGVSYCTLSNRNMNLSVTMREYGADSNQLTANSQQIEKEIKEKAPSKTISEFLHMSWMLGAGLTININDYTKLDIGSSYKAFGHLRISQTYGLFEGLSAFRSGKDEDINFHCLSVHLGVRFYF